MDLEVLNKGFTFQKLKILQKPRMKCLMHFRQAVLQKQKTKNSTMNRRENCLTMWLKAEDAWQYFLRFIKNVCHVPIHSQWPLKKYQLSFTEEEKKGRKNLSIY